VELKGDPVNDRRCTLLILVALLALGGALSSEAGAAAHRRTQRGDVLLKAQPISVSGAYTGPLRGLIVLDGVPYRLAADATLYEVGRGPIPLGSVIDNRMLCLAGVRVRGTVVVTNVLVRPAPDVARSGGDPAGYVHALEGPAAR
jgi:hypothetical protein